MYSLKTLMKLQYIMMQILTVILSFRRIKDGV